MTEETRPLVSSPRRNGGITIHRERSNPSEPPGTNDGGLCKIRVACLTILMTVMMERLVFYALSGNLVLFLNKLPYEWESYDAMEASYVFLGLSFVFSLFGGWMADSILGRFKAVLVSLIIYIVGYVFMPLLSPEDGNNYTIVLHDVCRIHNFSNTEITPSSRYNSSASPKCAWLIYLVLVIIAIGNGSFKANIAPFGADQVTREGSETTLGFFNWYYWCINMGAFIGMSAILWVEQQKSFFEGYLSALVCLAAGTLVFILGTCCYVRRPASGSVLTNIFRIIREACRMRQRRKRDLRSRSILGGRMVDTAEASGEKLSFLDYAKHRHGGIFHESLVEDMKELKKILCVFAVFIPYWMVYFQMQTTFLVQGLHMKLWFMNKTDSNNTDGSSFVPAWLSLFDVIFLIILLPLFDRVIYPRLERAGHPFRMTQRIVVGMVFAMAAMVVAGIVEYNRLEAFWPNPKSPCTNHSINQTIGGTLYNAADMSVLWQIPQYALIGISEVFTSVAGLQFAYSMAPKSMKGIIMGLFYFFSGLGSFAGTIVTSILSSQDIWFLSGDVGNINRRVCNMTTDTYSNACHLDYYFYFLAGVELLGIILFILVAKAFKLGKVTPRPPEPQTPKTRALEHSASGNTGLPHSIQRSISNIS